MARQGPITRDTSTIALGLAQVRVGSSAANIASTSAVLTASDSIGALAKTAFSGNVDYWKLESGFPLMEDLTIPLREGDAMEVAFKEISPKTLALARGIDPFNSVDADAATVTSDTTAGTLTGLPTVTNAGGVVTDTWVVLFTSATTYEVVGNATGHVGDGATGSDYSPDNGGNPYFTLPSTLFTGTWATDDTYTFTTTAYVSGTTAYDNAHSGSVPLGTITAPAFVRMEAVYTFPNGTNTMTYIFPRANIVSSVEMDMQAEDAVAVTMNFEAKGASSDVSGGNAAWNAAPLGIIVFG